MSAVDMAALGASIEEIRTTLAKLRATWKQCTADKVDVVLAAIDEDLARLGGDDEIVLPEEQYLILDRRTVTGNCGQWWRPNGSGYCCSIDEAGRYSYADAHSHRDTDIPVPLSLAEALVVRHVRVDQLDERMSLWPAKWTVEERLADPRRAPPRGAVAKAGGRRRHA